MKNFKKFCLIFLLITLVFVLNSSFVFADLKVGGKKIKVETPGCCLLKHKIEGWGSDYNAGTFVGAIPSEGKKAKDVCPSYPSYTPDPNWAGFCMLDAIASVGDIVKYAAMVAVGVALLIAAIMFIGAAGSPEKVKLAKSIFFYSLIGVLIATLANFLPGIVRFFLGI